MGTMSVARVWNRRATSGLVGWITGVVIAGLGMGSFGADQIRFARDVRPILSDACFQCHGPDASQRKAELRLDIPFVDRKSSDGSPLVASAKPAESELVRRLTSNDPDVRMPPPDAERQLTPRQVEQIRQWVEQGAKWEQHWSFVAPSRPAVPSVRNVTWGRNAIDRFIQERLDREGMQPSPVAENEVLARRMFLDVTGLPPGPHDVAGSEEGNREDRIERIIDKLLASPQFGERLAVEWLDAARYADTSGYQNDGPRYMWRWRDWVIDSLNQGMPFDQFTIEQLAGDLIPNASVSQRVATGFNRNHRGNAEGGIIPEEFAVEYVVDRVETTMTVWQGITIGCARCHEHKFDPISQREFYQLFAFFNSVPEFGRAIKEGNSPPYLVAPTREDVRRLSELDTRLQSLERRANELESTVTSLQRDWEGKSSSIDDWTLTRDLVGQIRFRDNGTANYSVVGDVQFATGRHGGIADLRQGAHVTAEMGDFGYFDAFSFGGWVQPRRIDRGTLFSRMTDVRRGDGYALQLADGKLQINLVKRWLDDALRLESIEPLSANEWHHVFVTYDGSRLPSGVKLYVDGKMVRLDVRLNLLNQSFATKEPFRIGAGGGDENRFDGLVEDVRIYNRVLNAYEVAVLNSLPLEQIISKSSNDRTPSERLKLRWAFLDRHAPSEIRKVFEDLEAVRRERQTFVNGFPTVMIMEETPSPREAFILARGQYDKPTERVERSVPQCLPPFPSDVPRNRLGFAKWIVSPENPLTSRVIVNRYWQLLFGTGLVKTTEDFGSQGSPPSHAELMDWLAVEFRTGGDSEADLAGEHSRSWDVKRFLRTILGSATYAQSSRGTLESYARDPENRLLSRGPRIRLSAEMVRDQALVASGLYVERLGGPSVKPYQPLDLWKELATDNNYEVDRGAGLYRRSMYTYWKRTVSPPTMTTFDAAGREACQVRRVSTNTPLQALALLNDVTYVEAARKLAERALLEVGGDDDERLTYMFRLVVARSPTPHELPILRNGLNRQRANFTAAPGDAASLLATGEAPVNDRLDKIELAAFTSVASMLLNLDEAVTKQ